MKAFYIIISIASYMISCVSKPAPTQNKDQQLSQESSVSETNKKTEAPVASKLRGCKKSKTTTPLEAETISLLTKHFTNKSLRKYKNWSIYILRTIEKGIAQTQPLNLKQFYWVGRNKAGQAISCYNVPIPSPKPGPLQFTHSCNSIGSTSNYSPSIDKSQAKVVALGTIDQICRYSTGSKK